MQVPDETAEYAVPKLSHRYLRFLKSDSVHKVLEDMRDSGVSPCTITDHPGGEWSTIPTADYTFCIRYLGYEQLSLTNELAQTILAYVFYGKYSQKVHSKSDKIRLYPVMRAIHQAITNPRRRFSNVVHVAFEELYDLLDSDEFDYEALLMDHGINLAPVEFMAAVENGTRQVTVTSVPLTLTLTPTLTRTGDSFV